MTSPEAKTVEVIEKWTVKPHGEGAYIQIWGPGVNGYCWPRYPVPSTETWPQHYLDLIPDPVREAAEALWKEMQAPDDPAEILRSWLDDLADGDVFDLGELDAITKAIAAIEAEREENEKEDRHLQSECASALQELANAEERHRLELAEVHARREFAEQELNRVSGLYRDLRAMCVGHGYLRDADARFPALEDGE